MMKEEKANILLVEDEENLHETLKLNLEMEGYSVTSAYDGNEAMKMVEANGFEHLHMAFYKNMDIGDDGVWDVWQIEGPSMRWYFRGAPHVHTWVHIREPNA